MVRTLALLGSLVGSVACGQVKGPATETCDPWRPRGGAWTSLATARPPVLESPAASADGRFVYAVGSWLEDGALKRGLLRSSDLGQSWCPLPTMSDPPTRVVPSGAHVLYAESAPDDFSAIRLLKSTDEGATWKVGASPGTQSRSFIVAQRDPSIVWALSSDSVPKLSVSTDALDTWTEVALPADLGVSTSEFPFFFDAAVDPSSAERLLLVVHTYQASGGPNAIINRLFVTDDAGATWQESLPLPAPDAVQAFVSAVVDVASSIFVDVGESILASKDWGASWESAGPMPSPEASLVDLHPSAPGSLFAVVNGSEGIQLSRSTDGGATWQRISTPVSFEPWVAPGPDPDVIVGEAAGGVVATRNGGADWRTGPAVPRPDTIVGAQVAPFPIWGLPQGLRSEDGGLSWEPSLPSAGRVFPSSARNAIWIADGTGEMRRTEDAGRTWTPVTRDASLTDFHGAAACPPPGACLYVLYGDSSSPYATTLERSDDGGKTWSARQPLQSQLFFYPDTLKVAPDDDRHLVGSGGPGLVQSRDGGETWSLHAVDTGSLALLGGGVLLASGTHRSSATPVTSRSTDDGATWSEAAPFAGTLFTSPQRPGMVYLLADGVYRSEDGGATWTRVSPESTPLSITGLADAPDGKLVAAISGYGLVTLEKQ